MAALKPALILVLVAGATPALAEQISCESHQRGAEPCGTIVAGSRVRLVRQLSDAPCIEGRTWGAGAAQDSLWVSGGCRAVFDVQPPGASDGLAVSDPASTADSSAQNGEADARDDDGAASRHGYAGNGRPDRDGTESDDEDSNAAYAGDRDDRYADSRDRRFDTQSRARGDDREDAQSRVRGDDSEDNPANGGRDVSSDDAARNGTEDSSALASAGPASARARQACIDEAADGRSFDPEDVAVGGVRSAGGGLIAFDLRTPDGDVTCIADRDGNVRSLR